MSVNIPQTANDLDTDSIAFECGELARQAEAGGADRRLDAAIVMTLCPGATVGEYVGEDDIVFHAEALGIPNKAVCPAYTSSVDAALTLVPEGAVTAIATQERWHRPPWTWGLNDGAGVTHFGSAATPALALCAAALRAVASTNRNMVRMMNRG